MKRTAIVAILALFGGAAGFAATQLAPVQTTSPSLGPIPGNTGADGAVTQTSSAPTENFEALHEGLQISNYLRDEIMAQGGTSIAVLVPFEITRDEAAARAHRFRLKLTEDGYSAVMGDAALDTVINGTAGDTTPDGLGGDYMQPYEDFDDGRGGSLAFGFRGADYQVEMYCLAEAPDPEANCLEAARLEAFVRTITSGLMGQ